MCYIDYDNVGFSEGKVVVRKSTDGGISWSNSAEAINITDCPGQLCIDRPWMVIDPSGSTVPAALYITTMNVDQPSMVLAPYHPYLSVSVDGGQTFLNPRHLDTLNFLAGATIPQPMPSPAVDGNGRLYAIYPSYLNTQSLYPRHVLAYTNDQGNSLDWNLGFYFAIRRRIPRSCNRWKALLTSHHVGACPDSGVLSNPPGDAGRSQAHSLLRSRP